MDVIEPTSFKPIGKNILVIPDEEKILKSAGGIILTETHDTLKREIKGKVVGVGEKIDVISAGDTVLYQKMYELSITLNGIRHVILKEEHILAVGKE